MSAPKLSIIIPAYNEEARLPGTLPQVMEFARKRGAEVIVVDDGSTDRTADIVQENKARLVQYGGNRGKGYAVRSGMLAATGDWRLFMDADLSTPLSEVDKILGAGTPVAIGSRQAVGANIIVKQPWYRQLAGKGFRLLVSLLLFRGIKDTQCGFKLFRKDAAEAIFSRQRLAGFGFDVEALFLARKLGFQLAEVPVEWHDDARSKVRFKHWVRMLNDILRVRWNSLMGRYD